MRTILSFVILFVATNVFAGPEIVLSMVPKGKIVDVFRRDYTVKTVSGSKIILEFKRSGKLEEARGLNLNQGDHLEPGDGLISLSSAAQALAANGTKPRGAWSLDHDEKYGWVYEIDEKLIEAKTGKLISEKSLPGSPVVLSED